MTDHVTAEGLSIPTIEDLLAEVVQDEQANVDPNIDTSSESLVGQLNGIFVNHLREAWEVLAIAYNGFNPDVAEGFLLEAVSAITGTKRQAATASYFKDTRRVRMSIAANTTVPAGTTFSQDGNPSVRFTTNYDWPTVQSPNPEDVFVDCTCTQLGPITCNATTLIVIETPVSGLISVINDYDAFLGVPEDTEPALRLRRERELRASGKGTLDATRSAILSIVVNTVEPVVSCAMRENRTMYYDFNGLPPKSFEALIFDGVSPGVTNDALAQTIWNTKPSGIEPFGNTSGTATDSEGKTHVIPFSRPTLIEMSLNLSIKIDSMTFAGDPVVKQTLINKFSEKVKPEGTVFFSDYIVAAMSVSGVTGLEDIYFGGYDSFTDVQLTSRQMAYLLTGDIIITHV